MPSGNTGIINAVNAAGFTAPPSTASPWTPGSYVQLNNVGPGDTGVTVTVALATLNAVLGIYYQPDGTNILLQVPSSAIWANEAKAYGAIAASTVASYSCVVPGGTVYVACSTFTGGSSLIAIESGSGSVTIPGAAVTPVSGTVTANIGTTGGLALEAGHIAAVATAIGTQSDTAETDSTSSWSVVSALKGIWAQLASVITKLNASIAVTNASLPGQPSIKANGQAVNALVVKASAGTIFSWAAYNRNTAVRYAFVFDNSAASGTILDVFPIYPSGLTEIGTEYYTAAGTGTSTGFTIGISTSNTAFTLATAADHDINARAN